MTRAPAIYAYDVPSCTRNEAIEALSSPTSGLRESEELHVRGMLQQIVSIEDHLDRYHRVDRPEAASLFWVPAYFPVLFWLDQRTPEPNASHLQCVRDVVSMLQQSRYFSRNAGYDHLLLYGYEYPHWKRFRHLVLDSYSPFLGNAILVSVSLWNQGRRSSLLDAGLYQLLRVVPVPYFARYDCGQEEAMLSAPRRFVVSFAGSIKDKPPYFVFRERLLVAGAAGRPDMQDKRLLIQVFDAHEEARYRFARDYEAERLALYANSVFCLAMPGDGNTAGRLFDAMVRGCIPVLMFHPDSYPVLPFVAWIPWNEFAMVFSIESEDDAATALHYLLATSEEDWQMRRKRTLQYAPMISLALQNCPEQITGALDLVSKELEEKVGLLNSALAGLRVAAPPADESQDRKSVV